MPDVLWPPLQRRLIDSLPGERILPRVLDLPGATVPRTVAIRERRTRRAERVAADPAVESAGLSDGARRKRASIDLFHAGGREAEIEEVFRRILASGATLDQVEIACASDVYAPLVWEKALRYDWPVTVGPGIQAAQTRPGRALLGFCAWIETTSRPASAPAAPVRRHQAGDRRQLGPGRAAALQGPGRVGTRHLLVSLTRLANIYKHVADDPDRSDEQRESAAAKIAQIDSCSPGSRQLFASVPEPDADAVRSICRASSMPPSPISKRLPQRRARSTPWPWSALNDAVSELRALGAFRCPLPWRCASSASASKGSPSAPTVRARPSARLDAGAAGLSDRRQLFVVGLEEGRVFPVAVEDPVLLDAEREKINPALRRSSDRTDEAVWAVLSRLATRRRTTDVRRHAELFVPRPARVPRDLRVVADAAGVSRATGNPDASYPDLKDASARRSRACRNRQPTRASDASWWLGNRAGSRRRGRRAASVSVARAGAPGGRARSSDAFTATTATCRRPAPSSIPARRAVVSPTQLEDAAACPFRHFLERGLGLQAIEDGERDRDVWLNPLLRGSLLHDLYARLLRRCRDEKRRPRPEERPRLARRAARGAARRAAPRDAAAVRAKSATARARTSSTTSSCSLEAEATLDPARTPVGFEVAFGQALDAAETEPLAQAEPVDHRLGAACRSGSPDASTASTGRARRSFEIVDYKTGGYYAAAWKGTFAGGTRAAARALRSGGRRAAEAEAQEGAIVGGGYYFSSARAGRSASASRRRHRGASPRCLATCAR